MTPKWRGREESWLAWLAVRGRWNSSRRSPADRLNHRPVTRYLPRLCVCQISTIDPAALCSSCRPAGRFATSASRTSRLAVSQRNQTSLHIPA